MNMRIISLENQDMIHSDVVLLSSHLEEFIINLVHLYIVNLGHLNDELGISTIPCECRYNDFVLE